MKMRVVFGVENLAAEGAAASRRRTHIAHSK